MFKKYVYVLEMLKSKKLLLLSLIISLSSLQIELLLQLECIQMQNLIIPHPFTYRYGLIEKQAILRKQVTSCYK